MSSPTLRAPACTNSATPDICPLKGGKIKAFDLYTLDDDTERDDDCAGINHKSLLYFVSGAFEDKPRIPLIRPNAMPLLGLARDVGEHIAAGFWNGHRRWLKSPTTGIANARHHGELDNDEQTLLTTLERITAGRKTADVTKQPKFGASKARIAQVRQNLDLALGSQ